MERLALLGFEGFRRVVYPTYLYREPARILQSSRKGGRFALTILPQLRACNGHSDSRAVSFPPLTRFRRRNQDNQTLPAQHKCGADLRVLLVPFLDRIRVGSYGK